MALRSWVRKLFGPRRGTAISKTRPRALLGVEVLEDRLVPATIVVNTISDAATDAVITNDTVTLREAINYENAHGGGDTITFDPSIAGQEIKLTNGQLTISQDVTIGQIVVVGQPVPVTVAISGNFESRVFDITSGTVQINNVTIEDGVAVNGNGGAILNGGDLTLTQSTVTGSASRGINGVIPNHYSEEGAGGGIYNYAGATLNLIQSTIADNTAQGGAGGQSSKGVGGGGGGGGAGLGGGIFNNGALSLVNSTVSGNTAFGGTGGNSSGNPDGESRYGYGGDGGGLGGQGGTRSPGLGGDPVRGGFGGGGGGGYAYGFFGSNTAGAIGGFGGGGGGGGAYIDTGLLQGAYSTSVAQGGNGGVYGGQGAAGGSTGYFGHAGHGYGGGGGGGAGIGGGIFSKSANLTITASTIADNSAVGGAGGSNGSVSAESGAGVAGGVFVYSGTASLDSTIIADNSIGGPGGGLSNDARGSFSGSFNLIEDATGVSGLSSSQNRELGRNPNLSALADNGGPTETMAIAPGSELEGGDPNDGVTVDQRNVPRISPPDIGAYQLLAKSTITVTAGPTIVAGSGDNLTASATLSSGVDPTGTITFTLYDPNGNLVDTESATVNGNGVYSTPTGYTLPNSGTVTGTYQWDVHYGGDTDDFSASDDNDPNGQEAVTLPSPTLTGISSQSQVTLGNAPVSLGDTAMLSGGDNPTGTITFTLDLNGNQVTSRQVTVNGDGQYTAHYNLPNSGTVVGTYQWNLSYSGDGNNGEAADDNDVNEQVTVSKASPTLSADPIPAQATLGPTSVTLTDAAALSGGFHETGTITFSLKYDNDGTPIYTDTVNVNGDGLYMPASYTLATTGKVVGDYQWDVTYSGDSNNNGADASANTNQANVDRAKPTLTGTPLPAAVTLGPSPTTLTDQALLLGGYQETGTISFSLYQGAGTTPVFSTSATVSGDGTYTTPTGYVPTAAGAYHWNIFYDGDANNEGIRVDNSAAEDVTVSPAPLANPMLSATAIPAAVTLGTSPVTLKDAAFLSGGAQETGTITFTLYYNGGSTPVDTETATVSGDGLYTTPTGYVPTSPGTYQWDVSYSGDGNNSQAADNGDVNNQVIVTASPQISLDQTMLNLGTTTYGTAGATETYDVSGNYLTGPVSIAAPTGVELSTDGANWSGSLTLNPVSGSVASTVIDVRISALADAGTISGDITASSAGAIEQDISVSGTVAPQALTVSIIGDPSKTYDGTTNAMLSSSNYQINGLVNGDNFTVTNTVGAYNSKDVATASTVTALLAAGDFVPVSGTFATNYTFPSSAAGPGQITAATLLYVANPVSRTYGSANPAFTGGVTGLEPGDTLSGVTTGTLTFTSSATAASSVGSYAITGAGLTVDTSDYVLAQAAGNATALTITPAAVTVTIIGDPSKTYDGTTTATLTPANYHISGLLNGDSFTVSNTTGAYNSKDVATASSVTAALVPADFVPVGNALASNYAFPTSASGPGKITPAGPARSRRRRSPSASSAIPPSPTTARPPPP